MKKHYAFLLGGLLFASTAFAQDQNFKRCSAMDVLEEQLKADPGMQSRMNSIEAFTAKYIKENKMNSRTSTAVYRIPVVVHVVWNTTSQNISDCQINSQIAVLNEDFQKLNADNANVPGIFAPLSADVQVEFVLAKVDPTGAPTTGITRTKTKTRTFSGNNAIKFTSQGGKDAWNTAKYLNFWVAPNLVDRGIQLLGYGQFPGGPASTDGVVMAYGAFGSRAKCPSGVYYQGYDLGRTTTHEVGHFLNLRHIWGDATCGDDLVADTPKQQTSNYGCPSFPHVTCANQGDMSMNFMDYTDDPCMNMFTTGQKARMHAVLGAGGFHNSLTTSTAANISAPTTNTEGVATAEARDMKAIAASVFPNPVTGEMNVSYNVASEGAVTVEIYNVMGALVGSYNQGVQPVGGHIFNISTSDNNSFSSLKNGVYFCRVNGAESGKVIRFVVER